MKTYSAKASEIERKWYIVDATDLVLGRMSSVVAKLLLGKHKPMYSPNLDCGDHVVVINAEKVHLTGKKAENEKFYWHTGYPGGIKERSMGQILEGKHPERVVIKAIERMVPRGKLGRQQMTKLKVYVGSEHPHEAQTPEVLDVASMNPKNKRRS
ncbi:MAG: 50S ribosomal protein L13 [Alphaproteobacteria bacterium]|nr:50S ribosomal protein L13 [Alphaproteobacteria bacterium]